MGESPTRPGSLPPAPLVEQPPKMSPFSSSTSNAIVSWPFSRGSGGSTSRSTHAVFLAARSETSAVSNPCSSANHRAPSPTSMTCFVRSMTSRAALIG